MGYWRNNLAFRHGAAAASARAWAGVIEADAGIAKPFDLDDLVVVVASCCADGRARRIASPVAEGPRSAGS